MGIAEDKVIDKPATGENSKTNKNQKPCVDKKNCSKNNIPLRQPEQHLLGLTTRKQGIVSIILEEMGSSDYLPEDVWRKII